MRAHAENALSPSVALQGGVDNSVIEWLENNFIIFLKSFAMGITTKQYSGVSQLQVPYDVFKHDSN